MGELTVVLDSCVLYPAPLRDFLMHLALLDLFRAKWTAEIHDEWIRNVLENRPDLTTEKLQRTRKLMDSHVRDCLVSGYQHLIDDLSLPNPDDRHVLAAAIHSKADVILTFNLRDFPPERLALYKLTAVHPDRFVTLLLNEDTETVCLAAERQRAGLKNPPKSKKEFVSILRQQGLTETCEILENLL